MYEIITVALAHDLRDGELGFTGLTTGDATATFATSIPLAAAELARRTHAPSLTIVLAGWVHNPDLAALTHLPHSEFDEDLRDLQCEAHSKGYPNHTWCIKRGDISFGFASGVQIDVQGNINSVCIGDYAHPKVRLVGPVLQPEHMSLFGREYVMMAHHDKRRFVERVDFISGVGYPGGEAGRRELGLEGGGPELVFTPKCIFDFDKERGRMRVKSIHPGVSIEELRESTGFDLGSLSHVPTTPLPTEQELRILREEVDPRRLLLPS
jgi:glutaconate CoA-transferase subunit B